MVQVINLGPSRGALQASQLGQGLQSLGQGLGAFYNNYTANKEFDELENNPELKNAPYSERMEAAERVKRKHGKLGEQIFGQKMQIEQQREQERESGVLRKALEGKPISERESMNLRPENQFKLAQIKKDLQVATRIKSDLENLGIEEDVAENYANLYKDATEGAKTQILNHILELKKRGMLDQESDQISKHSLEELGNPKDENQEFEWPDIKPEKGFTPGEVAKTRREREKTNIPFFNQSAQKVKAAKEEGMLLDRLEQLNPKMPTGILGKVNIDYDTGNLRIPAGSTPEVQLYVKTINEFTKNAKDSYGSRVTNFDLNQFMKRLPTLANSMEGREMIIKQMKIINQLNRLDNESIKDTYNKYGVGNINHQEATQIADQYKSKKESELLERYKDLDGLLKQADQENPSNEIIKMIAPNGKIMNVPQEKVEELEKLGAKRG